MDLTDGISATAATIEIRTTYKLTGATIRGDRRRRAYRPTEATVAVVNGTATSITLTGPLTSGVFTGSPTSVVYPIADGSPTADSRVEQCAPYWLQQLVDLHTPLRGTQ